MEFVLERVVGQELILELLRVQRVRLVDRLGQLRLRLVIQVLNLIDFVRVEDVLVADLLQEPIPHHKIQSTVVS